MSGKEQFRRLAGACLFRPMRKDDDAHANYADSSSNDVPARRPLVFNEPQPEKRDGDVDATVSRIRPRRRPQM